jgi:hypothetical protein
MQHVFAGGRTFTPHESAMPPSERLGFDNTPSSRLLKAVELLGQRGPMTYRDLGLALYMSKAATWRLVATLREARWVCIRHGGSIVQLDPRLDEVFATARFADAEFTGVAVAMSEVCDHLPVHIDLFAPDREGNVVLHETSRRLTVSAPVSDVPHDAILLAMFAAMTPPQLERYIAQMQASVHPDAPLPTFGATERRQVQQYPGHFFGPDDKFMVVSLRGSMGTAAAVRIVPKTRKGRRGTMTEAFNALRGRLAQKVQVFGKTRIADPV